jgi:hypothetical protein
MRQDDLRVWVSIISSERAANVPAMQALAGPATWVVPAAQVSAYEAAGAARVLADNGGLCAGRNVALEAAHLEGLACVQLSDDLRKLELAAGPKVVRPATFGEVVRMMREACGATGAHLAGIAPVANAFYFNPNRPYHTAAFILGDFIYVKPTELRFDTQLRLKEDYDYTLQHLRKYHAVARCNAVLGHFRHRTNAGGACAVRTTELEQASIAYLKQKWPGYIKDNPRRPDEILLSLK